MQVIVKNMVCPRCIWAVEKVLEQVELPFEKVELGTISLNQNPNPAQLNLLANELEKLHFEMVRDEGEGLVHQIKALLIEKFESESASSQSIPEYLTSKLSVDYDRMSRLFSKTNGGTIEQYYHLIRIEKAKELLHYKQLTAAEISYELGYSSPAHFSTQFKKATGLSPRNFQAQGKKHSSKSDL